MERLVFVKFKVKKVMRKKLKPDTDMQHSCPPRPEEGYSDLFKKRRGNKWKEKKRPVKKVKPVKQKPIKLVEWDLSKGRTKVTVVRGSSRRERNIKRSQQRGLSKIQEQNRLKEIYI